MYRTLYAQDDSSKVADEAKGEQEAWQCFNFVSCWVTNMLPIELHHPTKTVPETAVNLLGARTIKETWITYGTIYGSSYCTDMIKEIHTNNRKQKVFRSYLLTDLYGWK